MNAKRVDYLLIGGFAVGYYGYPRPTGDMDIWIARNHQNAAKITEVLREFGFHTPELAEALFLEEGRIVRQGTAAEVL